MVNYDEAKPGFVDFKELDGGKYTVRCQRSSEPDDSEGRARWDVLISARNFTHGFWMGLVKTGARPVDVALGRIVDTSGKDVREHSDGWTKAMEDDLRRLLRVARRFVKDGRGAVTYDLALVAIGLGVVLAVRVAVGVWG